MRPATPALAFVLSGVLWGSLGCRSATPETSALHPSRTPAVSFSESLESARAAYVETRAKELVRSGKFATKTAARDYARYEWAEQHANARTLGGEGYWSSTAPLRSPRQTKKQQKFLRDLQQAPVGPR